MLPEFRVEPGERAIAVEIERIEAIEEDVEEDVEEALPARLELTRSVTLAAESVALVTYDASGRQLVLVGGPPR